jgi:flagellar hook assembly protein FlgD
VGKLTMPKGETKCNIYDLAGDLVLTLEKNIYEQFTWNGLNKEGKKCSSGMYFYVVYTADGQTSQGKVVLIR